jgi:hypothetical protein
MIDGEPGQRARVIGVLAEAKSATGQAQAEFESGGLNVSGRQLLDLEIRRTGQVVARLTAEADLRSADDLHRLLAGSIRRSGGDTSDIADKIAVELAGACHARCPCQTTAGHSGPVVQYP